MLPILINQYCGNMSKVVGFRFNEDISCITHFGVLHTTLSRSTTLLTFSMIPNDVKCILSFTLC